MTLIHPVITEKSMMSARGGIYTFEVALDTSKSQVKIEVETAFKVNVISINMSRRHVPAKSTGSKRLTGNASQKKFAMLKLKKGQTIELFDLKEGK
ncbi:MAG: 50S ribosomal protein L23 [Microgenomates group bacterium]